MLLMVVSGGAIYRFSQRSRQIENGGIAQKTGLANPASAFCQDKGGELEFKSGAGGEYGICHLAGGAMCEEWSFFRGECSPSESIEFIKNSEEIAREWIVNNSSEYRKDGRNIELKSKEALDGRYEYSFDFDFVIGQGNSREKRQASIVVDQGKVVSITINGISVLDDNSQISNKKQDIFVGAVEIPLVDATGKSGGRVKLINKDGKSYFRVEVDRQAERSGRLEAWLVSASSSKIFFSIGNMHDDLTTGNKVLESSVPSSKIIGEYIAVTQEATSSDDRPSQAILKTANLSSSAISVEKK